MCHGTLDQHHTDFKQAVDNLLITDKDSYYAVFLLVYAGLP